MVLEEIKEIILEIAIQEIKEAQEVKMVHKILQIPKRTVQTLKYMLWFHWFLSSCGLTSEQRVKCWGYDYEGSLNTPPVKDAYIQDIITTVSLTPTTEGLLGRRIHGLNGPIIGEGLRNCP